MTTIWLIIAALIVPAAWGCVAQVLLERCWPHRDRAAAADSGRAQVAQEIDFQI
jgi:hypothetical protein